MGHPCITDMAFGERVHIDGNRSIEATVIGLRFHAGQMDPDVEVSWLYNGQVHTAWVDRWRLTDADQATQAPLPSRRKLEVVA